MTRALLRLLALVKKESLQIVRDPSTLLISFVFPAVLMLVFGAGINLDSSIVRLGVFNQDGSPSSVRLVETFRHTPGFRVADGWSTEALASQLRGGKIQGFVVLDSDFGRRMLLGTSGRPLVQVITDGAEPNGANFVAAYVQGAYGVFAQQEQARRGHGLRAPSRTFSLETRAWFNPSTKSRNSLLPGSVTIIMTVVGALLTALVVAREWERGTMEALLAAGVSRFELVVSKLIPYFVLGQLAFTLCVAMTHFMFAVPIRGSLSVLYLVGSAFLGSALGMGLLLSTVLKNQYNAAQAALNVAFLPALMLSGFVFEIRSMPLFIQTVSALIPARYFVTAMQTVFQAGDVWSVITRSLFGLTLATVGFIGLTFLNTKRRLE
jgi:ABC-2 type transport system permease protein